MKKKIEAELISIAHRILQLKDHTTLSELQEEVRLLYEKVTILNFSEKHFAGSQPTIGQVREAITAFPQQATTDAATKRNPEKTETISEDMATMAIEKTNNRAIEEPSPVFEDTKKAPNSPQEAIPEINEVKAESPREQPVIKKREEKLNEDAKNTPEFVIDEVNAAITEDLFIPATADEINAILRGETVTKSPVNPPEFVKNDMQDVTPTINAETDRPKSLNDKLKKNITIGLNDRLAFIKHLFEGSSADYNRVLSQLNTMDTSQEAVEFIQTRVKPDYHNWEDKEEYEKRFLEIVNARFD